MKNHVLLMFEIFSTIGKDFVRGDFVRGILSWIQLMYYSDAAVTFL